VLFGEAAYDCGEALANGVDDVVDVAGDNAVGEPDGLPQEAARSASRTIPTTLMLMKRIAPGKVTPLGEHRQRIQGQKAPE